MILFNIGDLIMNPYIVRGYYIKFLEYRLKTNPNLYNLTKIEELIKENGIPNIKSLFQVIDVDVNKNLYIPANDIRGKVLRYIEFGGESIKPTHILFDTTRMMKELYGGK